MLPEQALCHFPVLREHSGALHQGVNPVDASGFVFVLDAVAGLRIIEHHLASAAAALDVQLEEDDGSGTGGPELVLIDEAFNDERVKDGVQEADELGLGAVRDVITYQGEGAVKNNRSEDDD